MVSYSEVTQDITVDVVILPAFYEGLSRRGAWIAHTLEVRSLLKKFRPGKKYVVRYLVHEPDSAAPLSDGEINHLLYEITSSLDQYRATLERLEMQFRDVRKRGKLNAFIYLLGILTVRWYWWIFLTRGEMSFNNSFNAAALDRTKKTLKVIARFWERADDGALGGVLNEAAAFYDGCSGDPLEKYRDLRNYALDRAGRTGSDGSDGSDGRAWLLVADGYRALIKKLTGKSLYTQMLPTSFGQRLMYFFQRSYNVPEPECIFPVRNLNLPILSAAGRDYLKQKKLVTGRSSAEGNIMELYTLASKNGPPVCVPTKQALQLSEMLSKAGNMRRTDSGLEVVLHVGTESERRSLVDDKSMPLGRTSALVSRIQNASLDTGRTNDALISYYLKEQLPVMFRSFQVRYPFRSRLHSLFPWLFITNGIPVASVLAGVWLFLDPYYSSKFMIEYERYFSRILEGIDWSYHNMTVRVETDPALGYINERIKADDEGMAYREVSGEIGKLALPVSITDRIMLNNLTTETDQLENYKREANNFTTLPMYFFGGEVRE